MIADYLYWADMDYWTAHEAACLLHRIDPEDPFDDPRPGDEENVGIYKKLISRAREAGTIKTLTEDGGLDPTGVLEWADKKEFDIPRKLREIMERRIDSSELSAKDKRELGTLRQEKKKWDKSIEAAVYATHLFKGGEITRDKLWEALTKFDLPETTLEIVWKALRKEGLTKKAGRPKTAK